MLCFAVLPFPPAPYGHALPHWQALATPQPPQQQHHQQPYQEHYTLPGHHQPMRTQLDHPAFGAHWPQPAPAQPQQQQQQQQPLPPQPPVPGSFMGGPSIMVQLQERLRQQQLLQAQRREAEAALEAGLRGHAFVESILDDSSSAGGAKSKGGDLGGLVLPDELIPSPTMPLQQQQPVAAAPPPPAPKYIGPHAVPSAGGAGGVRAVPGCSRTPVVLRGSYTERQLQGQE